MLKTLKPYSKKDAQRLLARVTDFYLPNPGLDDDLNAPDEASSQVVAELRSRIGIDADDRSPEATSRILSELTAEMSEYALSGVNINSVKARLGQTGDLPLELYDLSYNKLFATSEALSVTREEVTKALHAPDAVEHLLPERLALQSRALSLFMQRKEDHFLLIQATRHANVLSVELAWRVYIDSVKLPASKTPLNIMRAFVDAYGILISVGEHPATKFVLDDAFPAPHFVPRNYDPVRVIDEKMYHFMSYSIIGISRLHVIEIVIAYAIDLERYTDALKKHEHLSHTSLLKSSKNSVAVFEPM